MRLKSTGLGATELFGDLTEMEKSMSGVLMRVKITKPVVWRVRVFLNPQDLRAIVWRALMPGTVLFVVGADAVTSGISEGRVPWSCRMAPGNLS